MHEVIVGAELGDEESFFVAPNLTTDPKLQPIIDRIGEVLCDTATPGRQQLIIDEVQISNRCKTLINLPGRGDVILKSVIVIIVRVLRADMGERQRRQGSSEQIQPEPSLKSDRRVV